MRTLRSTIERVSASAVLLVAVMAGGTAQGKSWPQWRGPDRSGVTAARSGWDGAAWRLRKLWQVSVGRGLGGSPIIVGGHVYVMGWGGSGEVVWCLDARSGRPVWKRKYAARRTGRFQKGESPEGPTCTPTFDAATGYLYTRGNDGDVHCWDTAAKGKPVWQLNLYEKYKVPARRSTAKTDPRRDYGYTSNVLIYRNWAIVEVGSPTEGHLMAFNKRTGRRVWASQDKTAAGHSCGPVLLETGGIPCVVSLSLEGLLVARLDKGHEGRTVAFHRWAMPYNAVFPTPCVRGDTVVLTGTGEYKSGKKTTFCQIRPDGIARTWQGRRQSYVCSLVAHAGNVYGVSGKLYCLDFATGALKWEGGRIGGATGSIIVTGDDRVIVWGNTRLLLVESAANSPDRYKQLASLEKPIDGARGDCYPHVALGEGFLVIRDGVGHLACYAVGNESE